MADNQSTITTITTLSLDDQKTQDCEDENDYESIPAKSAPSTTEDVQKVDSAAGKIGNASGQDQSGGTDEKIKEGKTDENKTLCTAVVERRASSKGSGEEDYFIAADLTLYSNPLNNALHIAGRSEPPRKQQAQQKAPSKTGKDEHEEDEIAADMTKYDSPMADLDKRRNDKANSDMK